VVGLVLVESGLEEIATAAAAIRVIAMIAIAPEMGWSRFDTRTPPTVFAD
jgi:hypothetical protein